MRLGLFVWKLRERVAVAALFLQNIPHSIFTVRYVQYISEVLLVGRGAFRVMIKYDATSRPIEENENR